MCPWLAVRRIEQPPRRDINFGWERSANTLTNSVLSHLLTCGSLGLPSPLVTGFMGAIVIGTVPFSGRIRRRGGAVRNMLPDGSLGFPVPKLLLVFGTSPVGDLAAPLATNGTRTPGHRWTLGADRH